MTEYNRLFKWLMEKTTIKKAIEIEKILASTFIIIGCLISASIFCVFLLVPQVEHPYLAILIGVPSMIFSLWITVTAGEKIFGDPF